LNNPPSRHRRTRRSPHALGGVRFRGPAPLRLPTTSRRLSALFLGLTVIGSACGGEPAAEPERPDFTRPEFTNRETRTGSTAAFFVDVSDEAGMDFRHVTGAFGEKWMPETMGSGAGFLDYDGDGWPDIFLVNSSDWPGHGTGADGRSRLYRNLGNGSFRDVSDEAGIDLEVYGMGVAFADYDADGDPDIYLTAVGPNHLLRNDGGRFTDVTAMTGTSGNRPQAGSAPAWSTGAAWVDVDRSGSLDLFVCNYVQWTPQTDLFSTRDGVTKSYATPQLYQGESCRLYLNDGDGAFHDGTEAAGLLNMGGKSLGIAVDDFNGDGWPDIVVANDTYQNFLYQNNGDGTFTDRAVGAGIAFDEVGRARAGMGIDVADVGARGRASIAIGNFSNEPLSLYTQMGGDLFQDLAGAARLTRGTMLPLTFGVRFADIDLDGHPDLIAANGHIEPEINAVQADVYFEQRPQLFWNNGRGQFVDVSDSVGPPFSEPIVARGIATADYDRDGDLDILMTVNGGRAKLLRNDLPATHSWIRLRLEGSGENRDAIGAEVTVFTEDLTQRQRVRSSSSYLSQSETNPLLVGLAGATQADSVWVRWPTSGDTLRLGPLEGGREHRIQESR
jgi:enediyne biosynthesis protein E4